MAVEFEDYDMSAATTDAAKVFGSSWTTDFSSIGLEGTGTASLVDDWRLRWLVEQAGPVTDFNILELGSFEGAHTLTLSGLGAKSCLGIEANAQHFMRSLVVKNHLNDPRIQFLLGDFNKYLANTRLSFDLITACGVLYHMTNPAELIARAAKRSRRLFIWTVLYDEEKLPESLVSKLSAPIELSFEGFTYAGRRHDYQLARANNLHKGGKFSGGSESYSVWLEYDELIRVLNHYGYEIVSVKRNEEPNPLHGGNVTLFAELLD